MSNLFNRRRQRAELKRPKREWGQRIGFRPEKRDQFINDMDRYQGDLENNRVIDEMERRANVRGQSLEAPDSKLSAEQNNGRMSDLDYGLMQGQVMAERAAKKVLPLAGLGGIAAAGAGYALNQGGGYGAVGQDPLAYARNNVAQANAALGSERMLEAMTMDQIDFVEAQRQSQEDAMTAGTTKQFNQQVSDLVDARAKELQAVPIQKSDGTVSPMGWDTAVRIANDEVNLQLRADGVI